MTDSKIPHRIVRRIAGWAVVSFFTRVQVIGGDRIPVDGPIIVTATHHNMMLDPAILSVAFPIRERTMNYWSKASLFANPVLRWLLLSTGNIPVERKSKDRRVLFKGTIEALAKGEAVALFPEGTSYTEPRIMQIKDGAAWAALEYTKWAKENPDKAHPKKIKIIPAAIVYTNKSKYRSNVIMEFAETIDIEQYEALFEQEGEGNSRLAVKQLTSNIYRGLAQMTINAPDWDTLFVARMARDLLWEDENSIPLDEFVIISQTLVDLFATKDVTPNVLSVRRHLLTYYSLLQSSNLTNSVLSSLPLSSNLDPRRRTPVMLRVRTLLLLLRDSLSLAVRLPFFLFPLVVHAPVYVMSRLGGQLAEDEEETQAQSKVVVGLLVMLMVYPAAFLFLWALLWFSPVGALVAAGTLYFFAVYHNRLINDNYLHAKRLFAAWRILIGVWTPKRWDLPLASLSQYTTPFIPPESPWVDRRKEPEATVPSTPGLDGAASPATPSGTTTPATAAERKKHRAPTRRVVRHVLRARTEAAHALAGFFAQLEQGSAQGGGTTWVKASVHLARAFGGRVEAVPVAEQAPPTDVAGLSVPETERGWRAAREVVGFLRKRGAKIATLERGVAGEWAAMTPGEQTGTESEDDGWAKGGRL